MKITIFGLAGTGKSSVGKKLAQKLCCAFVSTGNVFREQAKVSGVAVQEYDKMAEKDPSIDHKLDERIAQIGKIHENLVLESRLGWYFVPDSLKIKFVCDDEERFRRVAHRDGLSEDEAKRISNIREISHLERFNKVYGIEDYSADEHFDLIINTTNIHVSEIIDLILNNIKEK
jgi:cytidylate kinase